MLKKILELLALKWLWDRRKRRRWPPPAQSCPRPAPTVGALGHSKSSAASVGSCRR